MNTLGLQYPQVSHPWIQPIMGWNFKISIGWIFRCESWRCGSWLYFVTIISMKFPETGGPTIIRLPLPYKARNQSELVQASSLVLVAQSCPTLCDPRTVAHQAPLSMGFSRQESWSGLPCPPPGDLPNPGIEPSSLVLQANSLPSEPLGKLLGNILS